MICNTIVQDSHAGLGLTYLEALLPQSYHALAGYSGTGFAATVRMLHYDLLQQIIQAPPTAGIDRLVSLDNRGRVTGAAVSHFLPQFADALDYEQYLIVAADTSADFFSLLHQLRKPVPKFELITFRDQERNFLQDAGLADACHALHRWQLYQITARSSDIPAYLADQIPPLPDSPVRIEALPQRYCAFAGADIPSYSVWRLDDQDGQPLAICSLLPYCQHQEAKLWYRADATQHAPQIAAFLGKVLYLAAGQAGSAIWRIKEPNAVEQAILQAGLFHCVGQEAHYHFCSEYLAD